MAFSISKIALTVFGGLIVGAFIKDAYGGTSNLGNALGGLGSGAQSIGGALGSVGSGVQGLLTGIGTGASQLLNPFFTAKELIYGGNPIQQGSTIRDNEQSPATDNPPTDPVKEGGSAIIQGRSGATLSITDTFDRITNNLSIRGTPLAQTAISRTEPTFGGILSTSAGGSRAIRGSEALFARLAGNITR